MFRVIFMMLAGLGLFISQAHAHGGGLDSSGCHWNHKTGTYHCHRNP